ITMVANLPGPGVTKCPAANGDPAKPRAPRDKQQIGFDGVYVPTADPHGAFSVFPAERNPVLVLTPYRGDLGLDSGVPHSVYTLDQHQIDTGQLRVVGSAPLRLKPGQSVS